MAAFQRCRRLSLHAGVCARTGAPVHLRLLRLDHNGKQCRFDLRGKGECNLDMPSSLSGQCTFYTSLPGQLCALPPDAFTLSPELDAGEVYGAEVRVPVLRPLSV